VAVSSAYTFSYELDVAPGPGGAIEASARSLQEAAGGLPGLAGAQPLASIEADVIRFDARALPSTLGQALELVTLLLPPVRNWLIDRRLRRAAVRRIELSVPGLGALLQRGQVVRATLELDGSGAPLSPPRATVALLSEGQVVRTWRGVSTVMAHPRRPP
jgi:hypothetical protein